MTETVVTGAFTLIGVIIGIIATYYGERKRNLAILKNSVMIIFYDLENIERYLCEERGSTNLEYDENWKAELSQCTFLSVEEMEYLNNLYHIAYRYNYHYRLKEEMGSVVKEEIQEFRLLKAMFEENNMIKKIKEKFSKYVKNIEYAPAEKVQVESQYNENSKKEEYENYRNARMSILIAIIVIVFSVSSIVYQIAKTIVFNQKMIKLNVLNCYIIFICFTTLATTLILIWDIVKLLYSDLQRYNVLKTNNKIKELVDKDYAALIIHFKFNISFIFVLLFFLIPFGAWYIFDNLEIKILYWVVTILIALMIAFSAFRRMEKRRFPEYMKSGILCILKLVPYIVICFLVVNISLCFTQTEVKVNFSSNGAVEILGETETGITDIYIQIKDEKGNKIKNERLSEDILYAEEEVNNFTVDYIPIKKIRKIYFSGQYDIKEKIKDKGKYYILIDIEQGTKRYTIVNSMEYFDDYRYARQSVDVVF